MADDVSGALTRPRRAPRGAAALRRRQLARRLALAGAVWAAGLVLAALLIPAYDGETVSAIDGVTLTRLTLVQSHSAWIVALVMFPLPVSLVVFGSVWAPAERRVLVEVGGSRFEVREARRETRLLRGLAIALTVVLGLVGLIAIASIGAFELPVAIVGGLALALAARPAG